MPVPFGFFFSATAKPMQAGQLNPLLSYSDSLLKAVAD
jgi:hypothetical protein